MLLSPPLRDIRTHSAALSCTVSPLLHILEHRPHENAMLVSAGGARRVYVDAGNYRHRSVVAREIVADVPCPQKEHLHSD